MPVEVQKCYYFLPLQVCLIVLHYLGVENGELKFSEHKGEDPVHIYGRWEPTVCDRAGRFPELV